MISKSRFTATSAKKQGPIHLHFVCISLILCVSNRNDAKHFIASLHLRHEISFYGDPIESEGIFLLSYFCSKQSIGCIRYMKQNLSKLMKVLNAEVLQKQTGSSQGVGPSVSWTHPCAQGKMRGWGACLQAQPHSSSFRDKVHFPPARQKIFLLKNSREQVGDAGLQEGFQ